MKAIQGPAIFTAQFLRDQPPFDSFAGIVRWAAEKGYIGIQVPTWDSRMIDLDKAASSAAYCDDYRGALAEAGLLITELAAPLQGQTLAMHPAYADAFQAFYPPGLADFGRAAWAAEQLQKVIRASANMGLQVIPTLSGGFAWHMAYPWPPRPPGLIDEAFAELARRWRPLLDSAHDHGIAFAFELHPGSDLFDGATYEIFLDATGDHPAACLNYDPSHFLLQQLDYLEFIRIYGARIRGFHVKDAEFRPSGRIGVYGGYRPWSERAGRFRSLGDGQIDFRQVFTRLTEAGYAGWAVLEWECCVKSPEQGASEGAEFIAMHIIDTTEVGFDDFAAGVSDKRRNRRILGLDAAEEGPA
jgi:sugar phosphate isomerase/epimerase